MKHAVYRCDACNKILSDPAQKIALKHLSISFGDYSGWVEDDNGYWSHLSKLVSGIGQFCNTDCLKSYFDGLVK